MRRLNATSLLALLLLLGGCSSFTQLSLQPQIRRADEAFNQGNYALAATLYESLSDRYPALPESEELKLRQGIALYTLGSYHDARNAFAAYQKAFPEGEHKPEVEIYLDKIEALLSPDNPKLKAAVESSKKDLDGLQQLHVKHPYDPAIDYAIGNLYYEMGNYEEAMRYYFDALTIDAAYKEKDLVRQRMVIDEQGTPRPLTPEESARIERENQPLVVFNTNQYNARENESYANGQSRFFVVTGLIRNQGSRFLPGATVEVRFLDAAHRLVDAATVEVGPMGPGEVRPFIAEAHSYENIYNITGFECTARAEW